MDVIDVCVLQANNPGVGVGEWVCRHCYETTDQAMEKRYFARLDNEILHEQDDQRCI
jgi:hypothetical protein